MGFFGASKIEPGWLAVRFRGNGLDLAHVRRAGTGRPIVTRCEFHPVQWQDSEAFIRLRKEARLDRYAVTTLLGSREYQLLQVDAPNVPQNELKGAIRWRVKDLIDFHVDDAMIDVFDVPFERSDASRGHPMYVVAARNEAIASRISLFEAAKVPVSVIDIPEMAERNIASLFDRGGKATALLVFGEEGGLLTFTYHGELCLTRRIDTTAGDLRDADDELRVRAFERVRLELQRSLDYFDRQFHYLAIGALLLSPVAAARELAEYLAGRAGLNVEVLDLSRVLDLGKVPELADPEQQVQFLDVIGAALRLEVKEL